MDTKQKPAASKRPASAEADALDAVNARMREKTNVSRVMEASIESKAKKRRRKEVPVSAAWKQ